MGKKFFEIKPGVAIVSDGKGGLRKQATRRNAITTKSQIVFLDHLAATCNVIGSARTANVYPASLYKLRRNDAEFAEQWQRSLESGYATLEGLLLARARLSLALPDDDVMADNAEAPLPDGEKLDPEYALKLLSLHRRVVRGGSRDAGSPLRRSDEEQTFNLLMKKLDTLKIRIECGDAEA